MVNTPPNDFDTSHHVFSNERGPSFGGGSVSLLPQAPANPKQDHLLPTLHPAKRWEVVFLSIVRFDNRTKPNQQMNIQNDVRLNMPEWFCLRHRDGWLVGNDYGVVCYRTRELAHAALTIAYHRDGCRMNFRVVVFQPADRSNTGEYTPERTFEEIQELL